MAYEGRIMTVLAVLIIINASPTPPPDCRSQYCTPWLDMALYTPLWEGGSVILPIPPLPPSRGCVSDGITGVCIAPGYNGDNSFVYAVNASGSILWNGQESLDDVSIPIIATTGELVGWNESSVQLLDGETGEVEWWRGLSPGLEGKRPGPQATVSGVLIFVTTDGRLFGYFGNGVPLGVIVTRAECSGKVGSSCTFVGATPPPPSSSSLFRSQHPPAVSGERIFFLASAAPQLCVLWAVEHTPSIVNRLDTLWIVQTPCPSPSIPPIYTDSFGVLLVVHNSSTVRILSYDPRASNASRLLWDISVPNPCPSTSSPNAASVWQFGTTTSHLILGFEHCASVLPFDLENLQPLPPYSLCNPSSSSPDCVRTGPIQTTLTHLLTSTYSPRTNQTSFSRHSLPLNSSTTPDTTPIATGSIEVNQVSILQQQSSSPPILLVPTSKETLLIAEKE